MSYNRLLHAHREVNKLLTKLALGMGKAELNRRVVDLSEHWFGERRASILRLDEPTQQLHLEYAPSLPDFYNQAIEGVEIGENVGSCGAAASLKRTVVVEDINHHPNWAPFLSITEKANLRACWSVPILANDQTVMGTFAIYSSQPSKPSEEELEVLEMLASLYAVAWEKYQLEQQLHYHASYDCLTGCLNRRALLQRASDCLNTNLTYVACFFADIDKFKQINDKNGHEAGDVVLTAVGHAFKHCFSESGISGRYGGDEFVAFAFSDDEEALRTLHTELRESLAEITPLHTIEVNVSVGLSIVNIERLDSIECLIKQADKQMYQIKHHH
ncbi:GGDEF domain-containing protein [Vibrio coralliilyticus]|uniref:GGDEF domain-containing protein n=1 Tax=Vibrio coralliilyticus TaxID=190893 RepID=UPI000BAADC7A|nr:sensor domain-containing diguanylate cyclase [Vibrio coralliilyticus]NOI56377.1 sensor domain-containing diguanylate cyclase [Vibrio coralliilyticus]PAT67082.1 diguanylate cyclase [Vibrio coralliilyticus]